MCDAAGQLANRFHLLSLAEFCLQQAPLLLDLLPVGDVTPLGNEHRDLAVVVANRLEREVDVGQLAVGPGMRGLEANGVAGPGQTVASRNRACSSGECTHQGVSQNSLPITSSSRMPANWRAVRLASIKVPSVRISPMNWNVWSKMPRKRCSLAASCSRVFLCSRAISSAITDTNRTCGTTPMKGTMAAWKLLMASRTRMNSVPVAATRTSVPATRSRATAVNRSRSRRRGSTSRAHRGGPATSLAWRTWAG